MQYKTLILLATLATTSLVWAADDPYQWLENIDDEKSLDWVRAEKLPDSTIGQHMRRGVSK